MESNIKMKHLKTYESQDSFKETIMDICQDIIDDGYIVSAVEYYLHAPSERWGVSMSDYRKEKLHFFSIKRKKNVDCSEISDTLQRLKNYLGKNFHHFSYRTKGGADVEYNVYNTNHILKELVDTVFVWYEIN